MHTHTQKMKDAHRTSTVPTTQQYEERLLFSISLDDESSGEALRRPVTLVGHTRRIGIDELSLVGPFHHFGYRYLMGQDRTLQVALHLPNGVINLQGFPVRYARMSEEEMGVGYMMTGLEVAPQGETDVNCLIEVKILAMNDGDYARFRQYLLSLAQAAAEERATLPPFTVISQ